MTKLTDAEQAVLVELATGPKNQKEIAARLSISRSATAWHLADMYAKTGARNQVQLLRWAFREAQKIVGVSESRQEDMLRTAAKQGLRVYVLEYKREGS